MVFDELAARQQLEALLGSHERARTLLCNAKLKMAKEASVKALCREKSAAKVIALLPFTVLSSVSIERLHYIVSCPWALLATARRGGPYDGKMDDVLMLIHQVIANASPDRPVLEHARHRLSFCHMRETQATRSTWVSRARLVDSFLESIAVFERAHGWVSRARWPSADAVRAVAEAHIVKQFRCDGQLAADHEDAAIEGCMARSIHDVRRRAVELTGALDTWKAAIAPIVPFANRRLVSDAILKAAKALDSRQQKCVLSIFQSKMSTILGDIDVVAPLMHAAATAASSAGFSVSTIGADAATATQLRAHSERLCIRNDSADGVSTLGIVFVVNAERMAPAALRAVLVNLQHLNSTLVLVGDFSKQPDDVVDCVLRDVASWSAVNVVDLRPAPADTGPPRHTRLASLLESHCSKKRVRDDAS